MADFELIRISELDEYATPNDSVVIPVEVGGTTYKLSLADLKAYLHSNTVLTGTPTAPTPNPGSDNQQIASTEFVADALAGLGLGAATASTPGVVRTNTTDPAPVVYLKTEVDAINSIVRPVATGGTGAGDADTARTNLTAARSGSNSDITSLNSLSSIPSVISNAYGDGGNMPIGSVVMWAANSLPQRWLFCDGSTVLIADYPTLFSRLGTAFGGNGTTNFNLPNYRGRSPLGAGVSAVSGTNRALGATGGADTHTLSTTEIPSHSHPFNPNQTLQAPNYNQPSKDWNISYVGPNAGAWGASTIFNGTGNTGGGGAHNNLHPFQAIHFIIKAF